MKTGRRSFRQIIGKLYALLDEGQKRNFIIICMMMLASSVLAQVTPKTMGWLTDDILVRDHIDFLRVVPVLFVILSATVANEIIKILRRILVEDIATRLEKKARGMAVTSLLKAPLSFFKENMTGNIHGRLNRSLEGIVRLEKLIFMDFAPAIFNSTAAVVVIFTTLPLSLALPMLLVIPVGVLIVFRQISTQRGIRIELLKTKADMDGAAVELLNGIEMIRVMDSISLEEKRFDDKSEYLRKKEMRHHKQMALYDCLKFINEALFTVFLIGTSVYLAMRQVISAGAVLTSYLCFSQLIKPLEELHRILDELSESMVLADDFFAMAQIQPDFSYEAPLKDPGKREDIVKAVSIRQVDFSYQQGEAVLKNISFEVEKGTFIGIAGPSGCGKSSLIKAICKLERCGGEIFLDGTDLRELTREEIARIIALVPQNPFLIAGTIRDNICYGLDRQPTEQQINSAVKKAFLSEFVGSLPDKIDTVLSEGGANLSGGQRQRIAIARIFLRTPRILILDEATSALDNTAERFIQKEIEKLKKEKNLTVISIAHRLTTLKNSDKILVLNKGEIVQTGRYEELIQSEGIFSDMYYGKLK